MMHFFRQLSLVIVTYLGSLVCSTGGVAEEGPRQPERSTTPATYECDVCVYGGTASGMLAAVAAARAGKTVVVVEPSRWLGGIVGGGIRVMRDCLYPRDIGGLTRMMMEEDRKIGGGGHDRQPAFRECFERLAREHGIRVIYEHRLGRTEKDGNRITALRLDYAPPANDGCPAAKATTVDAATVLGKVFIDASYEGDLMARAEVSYVVGRESTAKYQESLAGQRHLLVFDVSPYVDGHDPSSGLLPMIDPEPYREGAASRHIIAYNFRLQWVNDGSPIGEPANYDEAKYALVRRAFGAKASRKGKSKQKLIGWPTDNYDRRSMISSGIPGRQSDYPDADWPERAEIWCEWSDHAKIMHKLIGSKRTLKAGEYLESNDFPNQLYVRMARRMVGRYVMTQHDLMCQTTIDDPIGLGYYKVDIYPCRLVATADGKVASEGETFIMVCPGPYPISHRSLTPKADECGNLLVPVCISASHVALSSIRMEPTYMIMGESAGIAAVRAIEEGTNVQDIDMAAYRKALLAAGQVLQWHGTGYNNGRDGWWTDHPEDYQKRPLETIFKGSRSVKASALDPGIRHSGWIERLLKECDTNGDGLVSRSEWDGGKKGWERLFPTIDSNEDGQIDPKEYAAFQVYKARNPDWRAKRPKTND